MDCELSSLFGPVGLCVASVQGSFLELLGRLFGWLVGCGGRWPVVGVCVLCGCGVRCCPCLVLCSRVLLPFSLLVPFCVVCDGR